MFTLVDIRRADGPEIIAKQANRVAIISDEKIGHQPVPAV